MNRITKSKAGHICLITIAMLGLTCGVGFQFHQNQELTQELSAFKQKHMKTVQSLDAANVQLKQIQLQNQTLEQQIIQLQQREAQLEKERARVKKVVHGVASAYTANCKGCTGITASGQPVKKGMVAMASWVPLGTKVKITSESYPEINGTYEVADRGGAIKGNRVDIFMESHSEAVNFGKRDIRIEILY